MSSPRGDNAKQARRIILEMGMGVALHSGDYTKAARRAVEDALHHSSLTLFCSLRIDPDSMQIDLNIAAQQPEKVDLDAVAAILPYGKVTPRATKGGLNVVDEASAQTTIIVNAGILVRLPV